MPAAVKGRERELATVQGFLERVPARASALLVSGPAGIGKTTLWEAAVAAAHDRGFRVVVSRPAEVETGLAFAGLNDLLGEISDAALPTAPAPQRIALEAALLRTHADRPPHPLAVSLAVLHVLRTVAADRPLLLAIDDVPWLDEPSVRALEFALRRLETEPVGILAARRTTNEDADVPALLRGIPAERLTRLDVQPLSVDAIDALLRAHLGLDLARPTLVRLHGAAAGNPFYALELGRAMQRGGRAAALDPLTLPSSLDRLVGERLGALSARAAEVALVASAAAQPTRSVLRAALGEEATAGALAEAIHAGVLAGDDHAIRFSHPLLAAAAYARASADDRRTAHARLAAVVHEPEEQAKHLALATTEPDEAVAAALEAAARLVAGRGAPDAGAELAERAVALTPPGEQARRRRRLELAADQHLLAGDVVRTRRLRQQVVDEADTDAARAEALARLAHFLLVQGEWDEAEALYGQAAAIVDDDLRRRLAIHQGLAGVAFLTWRNWRAGARHAAEMLRLAEQVDDPVILLQALGHAATWRDVTGENWRTLMERADALRGWAGDVETIEHPDTQFVRLLARAGDHGEARRRLDRLITMARERGDWHSLPRLLAESVSVSIYAGDLARAEADLAAARTGMQQTGEGAWMFSATGAVFELAVLRGQADVARAAAGEQWRHLEAQPALAWERWYARSNAALLELVLGNAPAAYAHIEPYLADPDGAPFPAHARAELVALGVDILVALGRIGEARELLDASSDRLRSSHVPWILAEVARSDAAVLAAEGHVQRAQSIADRAVELAERAGVPFVLGRALTTAGEIARRGRRKGRARDAFQRALTLYEGMGARVLADRARTDLARVAVRRPDGARLTQTEQQIVALVAQGSTNREIADALFMSPHTVESHLTRVFRTLGVQGRTELARLAVESELGRIGEQGVLGSAGGRDGKA